MKEVSQAEVGASKTDHDLQVGGCEGIEQFPAWSSFVVYCSFIRQVYLQPTLDAELRNKNNGTTYG
jgi:hypothetical protein